MIPSPPPHAASACAAVLVAASLLACAAEAEPPPADDSPLPPPPAVSAHAPLPSPACHPHSPPPASAAPPVVPPASRQLLLVTSNSWRDYSGRLQRYERRCDQLPWSPVGEPDDVMLGRHGMAWGRGLHPASEPGPIKAERDHRSPAGVFDLGEARGYALQPPDGSTWPFQHSGAAWRCMDNPVSEAYNTFIPTNGFLLPTPPGTAPRDVVFDLMIFVLHNTDPVQRGAGSCVFLHVWAKQGVPTQGCIAMHRDRLRQIVSWLSLDSRPVLAQLPVPVLASVASAWNLPHHQD